MTKTTPREFAHRPGCDAPRQLDVTHHEGQGITTRHCVDCGVHEARTADGTVLADPVSPGPFNADPKPGLLDGITIERMEGKR